MAAKKKSAKASAVPKAAPKPSAAKRAAAPTKPTASKKAASKKAAPKKGAPKKAASERPIGERKVVSKAPAAKRAAAKSSAAPKSAAAAESGMHESTSRGAVAARPGAEPPIRDTSASAAQGSLPLAVSARNRSPRGTNDFVMPSDEELAQVDSEPEPTPERDPEPPPIAPMPPRRADGKITMWFGTSSDQSFMLEALLEGDPDAVDVKARPYHVERKDLHELEAGADRGEPDVVVFTAGHYPSLQDRYQLIPAGGTFGDTFGAVLVARSPIRPAEVRSLEIAVPAFDHPATIVLRMWCPGPGLRLHAVPVPQISLLVRAERIRAGLLVNEDQLTYPRHNLLRVVDLANWWSERTEGLPLPMMLVGVRRDLPAELRSAIALDLKRTVAKGMGRREELCELLASRSGKLDKDTIRTFVGEYVTDMSLGVGERGIQALRTFYREGHRHGAWPEIPHLYFV